MTIRCPFTVHELLRAVRVEPADICPSGPRDLTESIVEALVIRETCTSPGPYFWIDGDSEDVINDGRATVRVSWAASVRHAGTVLDEDFGAIVGSELMRRRWRTLAAKSKPGYRWLAWDEPTSTLGILAAKC